MVKKLVLGIALSFASVATAAETQTVKFMMSPNMHAYPTDEVSGEIHPPHNGVCDDTTEIMHYFTILQNSDSYVDLKKDSLFCVRSMDWYVNHEYGPYKATADCTSFSFYPETLMESANCKRATIDLVVKNNDKWGFDIKLYYPDAYIPNDPCSLIYQRQPSKEELIRIPADTKSIVASLPYNLYFENPEVCLYLETYNPNYRETHGPFLKTGGLIVIHDTKTVTQEERQ